MGIQDHPNFKLGKGDHKHDDRTLMLAQYMDVPVIPAAYDFDRNRAKFPVHVWGNDQYGDCVIAAEANCLIRLERLEQKRTIGLGDNSAVGRYKLLTGCASPGDQNDTGLAILDAMNDWRQNGYLFNKHQFQIAAFGELEPADDHQLRAAIYLLSGIHFGFQLPISAQAQTDQGFWDVASGPEAQIGSWGGHCVFSCNYDAGNIYVKSWGKEIRVTTAFIRKYCDEVWAVVDDLDKWRASDHLDVQGMITKLHDIGAKNVN